MPAKFTNSRIWLVIAAAAIVVISFFIKVVSLYPEWIEKNYSRKFYPFIARFFRILFGWLPFSLGDVVYFAAGCYLFIKLIQFVKLLFLRRINRTCFIDGVIKAFIITGIIYIYFNLAWGLNYNRPGIASQLQLSPARYSTEDLRLITSLLLNKVNETRIDLGEKVRYQPYKRVFVEAQQACQNASKQFAFLSYKTPSVKRSFYGRLGNFLGFVGYYNPFTGEAQLNLTQPRFLIPYVSCHEMSHQLGYASESEANFAGYLICMNASDTVFHYSAYFDLFNYANHELFVRDSATAKKNYRLLDTLVKKDYEELRDYWRKSDNPIEPYISVFYDRYLKANHQRKGMRSYNEVTGWLIAYYKKYGKI